MKKKEWLILIVIFLLAVFLRFWHLGINPPSLAWDEAAWGYNAYSLGLTGRDEFGRILPWDYFESFGDFKPPVYAYLTVLPVRIFGLNEFAVRFPSALLGVLTVLLTYFLAKELFFDRHYSSCLALLASFLLTISSWHIMLSRAAFEANAASFFLVAGVTFFLLALRKKVIFLVFSAVSFALSVQTFNTARIVVPLLVLGLAIGFRDQLWQKKKTALIAFIFGLLVILPAIPFFMSPQSRLRYKEVNIFSNPEIVNQANQEIANDHGAWWSRIIHNRRWGYTREYLRHYFGHINPKFLFIKGDGNPKFSTQDVGELYLWDLPFLLVGIYFLFKSKGKNWWLIPFWFLAGIIPAATARETPHALRTETVLPVWQILISLGAISSWEYLKKLEIKKIFKQIILIFTFVLLFLNFLYFQHGYWRHYPIEYAGEWQFGYKPAIEYIKAVEDQYSEVWLTDSIGRPYIYLLFYLKPDPRQFWWEAQVEREALGFVKVKSFGKYHLFQSGSISDLKPGILYIDSIGSLPSTSHKIETFYLPNGKEILAAFVI